MFQLKLTLKCQRWLRPALLVSHVVLFLSAFPLQAAQDNWTSWSGDDLGHRYSELDQINTENVSQLAPVGIFSMRTEGNYVGSPLAVNGKIYLHTPNKDMLYAINQNDLKPEWVQAGFDHYLQRFRDGRFHDRKFGDQKIYFKEPPDIRNKGMAYHDGKIFWYRLNGTLEVIDAKTGKEVWAIQNANLKEGVLGGTPPMIAGDNVVIGMADIKSGIRGYLTAYRISDGKLVWRAYTYGSKQEMLIGDNIDKTFINGSAISQSGIEKLVITDDITPGSGAPTGWISYDSKLNLIYYGTNSPRKEYDDFRVGPQGFLNYSTHAPPLSSLWARDVTTGELRWVYHFEGNDQLGYQASSESILTTLTVEGKTRKVIIHPSQNGWIYVLDRENGSFLYADKIDPCYMNIIQPDWDIKPDADFDSQFFKRLKANYPHEGFCPSMMTGGKPIQPASFSMKTELVYIPGNVKCMTLGIKELGNDAYRLGTTYDFYFPQSEQPYIFGENGGYVKAWDPQKRKFVWEVTEKYEILSGLLSTSGNLLFYATLDGQFKAVNSKTGELLYHFKMPMGSLSNIITWMNNDKQFVGVLIGKNERHDQFWFERTACNWYTDNLRIQSKEEFEYEYQVRTELCDQNKGGAFIIFTLDKK